MLKSVLKAAVPFATALASVGLAWIWIEGGKLWIIALIIPILVVIFCATAFEIGEQLLPSSPNFARQLMELNRLSYWVVAAVGAALVVWLGIEIGGGDLEDPYKSLIGAIGAGSTAFVTAMFASMSDEKADETLGERIQATFQKHYVRPNTVVPSGTTVHRFKPGSQGERLVYASRVGDITGWDHSARKKRTEVLAIELKSGNSDPP